MHLLLCMNFINHLLILVLRYFSEKLNFLIDLFKIILSTISIILYIHIVKN